MIAAQTEYFLSRSLRFMLLHTVDLPEIFKSLSLSGDLDREHKILP